MTSGVNLRESLVSYLSATGWEEPASAGPAGASWSRPGTRLRIPVPEELGSADWLWADVIRRLAEVEGRTFKEVDSAVKGWTCDVTNVRAANDIVIADTIPLEAGAQLVTGAWTMFRACATTSLGGRAHIRGNYRKLAELSVASARMAHTVRGSYVVPIMMPLTLPEDRRAPLPDMQVVAQEPAERRITRTFAEALNGVKQLVVDPEREPKRADIHDLVTAGVSHEFMSALHRIVSAKAVATFSAEFQWSPAAPSPASLPQRVEIPAAAEERLEAVSAHMRQVAPKRLAEVLTGPVVEVRHIPDEPIGSAVIQTTRGGRMAFVRVPVSAARLDQVLTWMRSHETAVISGRVRRDASGLRCDRVDAIEALRDVMLPSIEALTLEPPPAPRLEAVQRRPKKPLTYRKPLQISDRPHSDGSGDLSAEDD